jgi:hypothetical protein
MNNRNKEGYDFSYHQASGVVQVPIASDDFRALKIHSDTAKTFDFSMGPGLGQLEEVIIESSKELKTLMWPKSASTVTCLKLSYLNRLSQLDLSAFPNLEVLSIMGCPALSKISGISSSLRVFNAYDVNLEQIDLSAAKRLEVFNVRTNAARFNINLSRYTGLSSFSLVMNQLSNKKNKVMIDLSAASKLRSCLIETQHATAQVNLTGCDHLLYKHFVCSDDSAIQQAETGQEVQLDPDALRELSSLFQRDIRVIASHYDGVLTVIKQLGKNPSGGEITLADIALVSLSLTNRAHLYRPGEVAAQSMMQALASLEHGAVSHLYAIPVTLSIQEEKAAHPHSHAGLWNHPHQDHSDQHKEGEIEQIDSMHEPKESAELSPEHESTGEGVESTEHKHIPEDEGFHEEAFDHAFDEAYDVLLEEEEEWTPEEEAWLEDCRDTVHDVYEVFEELYRHTPHKTVAPHTLEEGHTPHPAAPHASPAAVPHLKAVMQRLVALRPVTPPAKPEPIPPSPPQIELVERPKAIPSQPKPVVDETLKEVQDEVISKTVTHHTAQLPVIEEAVIEELTRWVPEITPAAFKAVLHPTSIPVHQFLPDHKPSPPPPPDRTPQYRWDVIRYTKDFLDQWSQTHQEEKPHFDDAKHLSSERMKNLGTARDQQQAHHVEHFRYFTPRLLALKTMVHELEINRQLKATQDITEFIKTTPLQNVVGVLKDLMKSQAFVDFVNQGLVNAKPYSIDENGNPMSQEKAVPDYRAMLEGKVLKDGTKLEGDPSFKNECLTLAADKKFTGLLTHSALTEDGQFFLKLLAVMLITSSPPKTAVFVRPNRFNKR